MFFQLSYGTMRCGNYQRCLLFQKGKYLDFLHVTIACMKKFDLSVFGTIVQNRDKSNISFIPESNATILAQSAKNVKLGSYEKLQKIKS